MKNLPLIVTVVGFASAFFAVILNLVPDTPATAYTLTLEAVIAAVIAGACGAWTFRRGAASRFLAIAMIGPAIFTLADAGVRLAFFVLHKQG